MEHRWNKRQPTRLDAILVYPPLGLVRAKLRDVSVSGAFIETDPLTLHVNTPVDVMLRLPKGGASVFCRLPALVIWVGQGRAGLMFRSLAPGSYDTLRGLLHEDMLGLAAAAEHAAPA